MATVTPPRRSYDLTESHRRVRDPLQKLRSYIRLYVALECLALLGLFLAGWFWIGLILDFGVFKLSALPFWRTPPVDWLDVSGSIFKVVLAIVLVCLGVLVAFKAGARLWREFSDGALALLLERRFPELLGDRLITAVELADPRLCSRYGYSPAMVEKTIHDAAERVDQVPVREVFNWRRLAMHGALVGCLTLGLYVLVGIGFCAFGTSRSHESALSGFGRLHDVASIWTDRNVLLKQTYWPRRAYLELVGFPDTGELRIPRESGTADIRVRAYKWVIADPEGPYGWRAMVWSDVTPKLLGSDRVPELPSRWQSWNLDKIDAELARHDLDKLQGIQKTMDRLEMLLKDAPVKPADGGSVGWLIRDTSPLAVPGLLGQFSADMGVLTDICARCYATAASQVAYWRPLTWDDLKTLARDKNAVPDLPNDWTARTVEEVSQELAKLDVAKLPALKEEVMAPLEKLADTSRLNRPIRKLEVPDNVLVMYWNKGAKINSEMTMQKRGDNEYSARLTELTDSVKFSVRGEDYYTPEKAITVLAEPSLDYFVCDQYKPAYIFYRLEGSDQRLLSGQRQIFADVPLTAIKDEPTRVPPVPVGSRVVIRAETDRALGAPPRLTPLPGREAMFPTRFEVTWHADQPETFAIDLPNLQARTEFVFSYHDPANVGGRRQIEIEVLRDNNPEVEVGAADYVRKITEENDFKDLKLDAKEYKDLRLMSVGAFLPIAGKITDDHGLARLEYVFTVTPLEAAVRAGQGGGTAGIVAGGSIAGAASKKTAVKGKDGRIQLALKQFEDNRGKRPGLVVTPDQLPQLLKRELQRRADGKDASSAVDRFDLEPDAPAAKDIQAGLDLPTLPSDLLPSQRPLKMADEKQFQPRFILQLDLEATDNDIETGPHTSINNKGKITFLLVSEHELLTFVGREEEKLHFDLKKVVDELRAHEGKLIKTNADIAARPKKLSDFSAMGARITDMEQDLDNKLADTGKVYDDYLKILRELHANRVQSGYIAQVQKNIVDPLKEIKEEDFPATKTSLTDFRKILDDAKETDLDAKTTKAKAAGDKARADMLKLIDKLDKVLGSMESLTTINKLITLLKEIEEREMTQIDAYRQLKEQLELDLLDKALRPDKK